MATMEPLICTTSNSRQYGPKEVTAVVVGMSSVILCALTVSKSTLPSVTSYVATSPLTQGRAVQTVAPHVAGRPSSIVNMANPVNNAAYPVVGVRRDTTAVPISYAAQQPQQVCSIFPLAFLHPYCRAF